MNINLRKLADVFMSTKRCARNIAIKVLSISLEVESLMPSQWADHLIHIAAAAKSCRNMFVLTNRASIAATQKSFVNVVASVCVCSVIVFGAHGAFRRSWKAVTRTDSRLSYSESDILPVMHVLGCNIATFGSVLHTLLKLENKGNYYFFITKKTLTRRFGNYCISLPFKKKTRGVLQLKFG